MSNKVCPYCDQPLMKIDRYGEVLIGCIDCNRWGHPGDPRSATPKATAIYDCVGSGRRSPLLSWHPGDQGNCDAKSYQAQRQHKPKPTMIIHCTAPGSL